MVTSISPSYAQCDEEVIVRFDRQISALRLMSMRIYNDKTNQELFKTESKSTWGKRQVQVNAIDSNGEAKPLHMMKEKMTRYTTIQAFDLGKESIKELDVPIFTARNHGGAGRVKNDFEIQYTDSKRDPTKRLWIEKSADGVGDEFIESSVNEKVYQEPLFFSRMGM